MSSEAEKCIEEIERIMEELNGSSLRSMEDQIEISHDVPGHTSIHIPSEHREFLKRKYED